MNWFTELILGTGTAHSILVLSVVIVSGLAIAKWRIAGISIGSAWILFVGIVASHFGLRIDAHILHFIREFGLVLFIFSIGLQVGPGFLAALKRGGLRLNLLAVAVVLLGLLTTVALHFATGLSGATLVGIMSGAVTNTPGLGAAQEAYTNVHGSLDPSIAAGYAMAYPLAVLGIIASLVALRMIGRTDLGQQAEQLRREASAVADAAGRVVVRVENPAIAGRRLDELAEMIPHEFVVSRVWHPSTKSVELVDQQTVFEPDDQLLIIAHKRDRDFLETFFGPRIEVPDERWEAGPTHYESRRVVLSRPQLNGVPIGQLSLRSLHGVNVTRIHRAGTDLVATPGLRLVLGDRLTLVGVAENLKRAERVLGNSASQLDVPNLIVIFLGILLGVGLGSVPFDLPGVPQPIRLGLAGGPLIIALLLGRFGPQLKLITYSTVSANLMLREIGMALFLAGVGLGAGESFVSTIVAGGYVWIGWGLIITLVPLLTVGLIGQFLFKINHLTLIGMLAGATTDPPALAYTQSLTDSDAPAVGYATVYPLTMFLRVVVAQLLIVTLT